MKNFKKIILGTNNPHKKEKLSWIVEGFFDEIVPFERKIEIDEKGKSFEKNAQIKSLAVAKKYGCYAIASDGGVLIPALGNNWNELLTRRFVGKENVSDFERIDALLEIMRGKKGEERRIIWREAIAIANPERVIFSSEVEGDTGLLQETYNPKQYKEGIWLCTITSYPQFGGKNFFELSEKEKEYGEISWHKLREKTREFLSKFFKIQKCKK